eukprot:Skav206280  [mRNA]  locus=scaffold922:89584:89802:- [translate_table: standard]
MATLPQVGPTYVVLTFGTFVCTTCGGLHREFSHKVKACPRGARAGSRSGPSGERCEVTTAVRLGEKSKICQQ